MFWGPNILSCEFFSQNSGHLKTWAPHTHNKLFTKFGVQSVIHKGKNRYASQQNIQKYIVNLSDLRPQRF